MNAQWTSIGRMTLEDGRLRLPEVTTDPGLYRLTFASGAVYIGEASDLQRRLADYLKYYPSVGIESEFRLNKRLKDEHGAQIEVLTGEEFETRSGRCQREHQEIKAARSLSKQYGFRVLNGGTVEERIAFYKSEIERLEDKLRKCSGAQDLDETMHAELLQNASANAHSDELARKVAIELGFSDSEIDKLIGQNARVEPDDEACNKEGSDHGK